MLRYKLNYQIIIKSKLHNTFTRPKGSYNQVLFEYKFLYRNTNISTGWGSKRFLFLSQIMSEVENSLSEKTVAGGADKCLIARAPSVGKHISTQY